MNTRTPNISIILPVYNGASYLERAFAGLRASEFTDFEIIAIDDGSTDNSAALLEQLGPDVLLRSETNQGVSAARNTAAAHARASILYFTDADVVIRPDTLGRVARAFEAPACRCMIGLYAAEHPNANLCSRYKNAWIRYSYIAAGGRIDWFFTAVGAVRKSLLEQLDGFDENLEVRFGGGDIDFGRRLAETGEVIHLDRELEVVHLKRYSPIRLFANEFSRAYGFSRLALRESSNPTRIAQRGVGNVKARFIAGIVSSWLAAAALLAAPWGGAPAVLLCFAALALHTSINFAFYRDVATHYDRRLTAAVAPLLLVDQFVCGVGCATAIVGELFDRVFRRGSQS